ncbi:MAG: YtxH domain-containing protein [Agriterribacter sp.]
MKVNTNVVLGLLTVTAIGAIAAIVLSPEKDSKTKKKILKEKEDLGEHVKSFFGDFVDMLKGKYRKAKNTLEDVAEKGASTYEKLSKEAKNAVN